MKKELSAWSVLLGAAMLGSLVATTFGGCRSKEQTVDYDDVDTSLDLGAPTSGDVPTIGDMQLGPASNQTVGGSNQTGMGFSPLGGNTTAAGFRPLGSSTTGTDFRPLNSNTTDNGAFMAPKAEPSGKQASAMPVAAPRGGDAAKPANPSEPASQQLVSASNLPERDDVGVVDDPNEVLNAGGDWPQWGGTRWRNNVSAVKNVPTQWNVGKFDRRTGEWDDSSAENIRWVANLGSQTYGNPVIAGGQVYVGTNNGAGYVPRYPANVDLGCLIAFDEKTGKFLWQHSSEKLITGRVHDWPLQGICCSPLVEGDRLWFVTSRGEVRCLSTKGFHDGVDAGPVKDEVVRVADLERAEEAYEETIQQLDEAKVSSALSERLSQQGHGLEGDVKIEVQEEGKRWTLTGTVNGIDRTLQLRIAGPRLSAFKTLSIEDKEEADVIWIFDMMAEPLGVSQHNMCSCSVTAYGDLLFVNTSNGLDESHINLPAPSAPSFICLDKNTGELLWADASPGTNILHGQWSSPTVAVLGGVPQVLNAGGDGWLYSFRADRGVDGKPELLWKFDCNPKESKWILGGQGTRNNIIGTPVIYDGLVYIAVGQDPEHGEGEGHLWCIDPTKRGDVSPQLAMKVEGDKRVPLEHRRIQAVIPEEGDVAVDNPNSAVVWHYHQYDQNDDGIIDFEEEMHRTIGTISIKDDLLYVADLSGIVHCLDAKGTPDGQPIVHFTYDMLAQSWGSPLIVDGHVYIGDEDGEVAIFELGKEHSEPIAEIYMGSSIYSTPVAANGTIFISTKDKLFAIAYDE